MSTNTKVTFEIGKFVSVWEPKGCRELKSGASSSERTGGEYEDIFPEEKLKVVQKLGSTRAIVERENGMRISMHLNHINPSSSYYALRGQKSASQKPMAERKMDALAKLQQAKKELEELMALQKQAEAEASAAAEALNEEEEEIETASDEARDEARALFENVG